MPARWGRLLSPSRHLAPSACAGRTTRLQLVPHIKRQQRANTYSAPAHAPAPPRPTTSTPLSGPLSHLSQQPGWRVEGWPPMVGGWMCYLLCCEDKGWSRRVEHLLRGLPVRACVCACTWMSAHACMRVCVSVCVRACARTQQLNCTHVYICTLRTTHIQSPIHAL